MIPRGAKTAKNHPRPFWRCFSSLSSSVGTFATSCSHQHRDTPRRAFGMRQAIHNAFTMAMEVIQLLELLVITVGIHQTSIEGDLLPPQVVDGITNAVSARQRSVIIRAQHFAVFLAEDNSFFQRSDPFHRTSWNSSAFPKMRSLKRCSFVFHPRQFHLT